MLKFYLCVFLTFGSTIAAAQTAIEGSLHDNTGKPVPGAILTLKPSEGTSAHETSNSAGEFHFGAVGAGTYTLQAEAPGFYPTTYNFILRPRQPMSLTIELQPKQSAQQTVKVHAHSLIVDPEKTGSSYTFTQ